MNLPKIKALDLRQTGWFETDERKIRRHFILGYHPPSDYFGLPVLRWKWPPQPLKTFADRVREHNELMARLAIASAAMSAAIADHKARHTQWRDLVDEILKGDADGR